MAHVVRRLILVLAGRTLVARRLLDNVGDLARRTVVACAACVRMVLAHRAIAAVRCSHCSKLASAACRALLCVVGIAVRSRGAVFALAGRQPAGSWRRQAHGVHIVGEIDDIGSVAATTSAGNTVCGAPAAAAKVLNAATAAAAAIRQAVRDRPPGGEISGTDSAVSAGSAHWGGARRWHGRRARRWGEGRKRRWRSAGCARWIGCR